MIIWRGRGFAIALVVFACLLIAEFTVESALGDDAYYQIHGWPKLAGLWLAAGAIYKLQPWLRGGRANGLGNPNVGHDRRPNAEAELFFVSARFWPHVLLGLGVIFLFVTD